MSKWETKRAENAKPARNKHTAPIRVHNNPGRAWLAPSQHWIKHRILHNENECDENGRPGFYVPPGNAQILDVEARSDGGYNCVLNDGEHSVGAVIKGRRARVAQPPALTLPV